MSHCGIIMCVLTDSIQVLSVSCGAEHTLALCKEGVYSWGSSSHGQVGKRHNMSVFISYAS